MVRTVNPGISIVEVLLGIVVLSAAILISSRFSKNSFMLNKDSQCKTDAYYVAESKLSDLSAAPIPPTTGTDTAYMNSQLFSRAWTITVKTYAKQAKITVSWTAFGRTKSINYLGAVR